jgi:hypothetical protein
MPRTGLQIVLGISAAVALVTGAWGMKYVLLDPRRGLATLIPTPGPEAVA